MRKISILPLFLALGLPVVADDSIFWLDKDAAEKATAKLTSIPEAKRDAATWVKLGWSQFLYSNDAELAIESFRKATKLDPKLGDAWEGIQVAAQSRLLNDLGAEAVSSLIMSEPDSARVEAMLRVGRVQGSAFAEWAIPQRIEFAEKLLATTKNPFTQDAIRDWLQSLYSTQLRTDKAFEHWLAQGHVRRLRTCGFFGAVGAAAYDDPLAPESEFKPGATYAVYKETASWSLAEYGPGDTAADVAVRGFTNHGTTFYAHAVLESPAERKAFVKLGTTMSAKVWLNGVPVGTHDLMREMKSNEGWFGVTLSQGANVLLVKFTAPGFQYDFDLTIHDEKGFPMTDLGNPAPDVLPAFTVNGHEARGGEINDALTYYTEKTADLGNCTLRDAILASQLLATVGLNEKSSVLERAAFERSEVSAYMQSYHAGVVADDPFLPPARRENIARTLRERALALDPHYAPALLELAREYEEKDTDKANDLIRQVLAINPKNSGAWQQLAGLNAAREWRAEQRIALEQAVACSAGNPSAASALARYHADDLNYPAAFEITGRIRKEQGYEASWDEIGLLQSAGRDADLLAALEIYRKRFPQNVGVIRQIAGVKGRIGKPEEVEAILKEARALSPRDGETIRQLLAFYMDKKELDKARALIGEIMAAPSRLNVFDIATQKYLDHLASTGLDWTKPWQVDVPSLVKAAPAADKFPGGAQTVVLFEQRLVRFMGNDFKWREEDTHRVVKILSKAGGENYGQLFLGQGEWSRFRIRELRVFTPDGRVLEMDAVQEEGNYRMPELDAGAVLEFRVSRGGGPIGGEQLAFEAEQSPIFRHQNEPVLWERYAVVFPNGAETRLECRNTTQPEVTKTDTETTYLWEFRDLADYTNEAGMPSPEEVLPNVRFLCGKPSFEQLLENLRSRSIPPPIADDVAAKAAELTKGLVDDEAKARALFDFCATQIKTGRSTVPSHTLADGEGQADDLFWALARAAKLDIDVAFARPPRPGFPDHDPEVQVAPYWNPVFLLHLKSGDVWLWPLRWNSFGAIQNELYGGEAIVIRGRNASFRAIPEKLPETKVVSWTFDVKLDALGVADVSGKLFLTEGRAAQVRGQLEQSLGQDSFKKIVEGIANRMFPGVTVAGFGVSDYNPTVPVLDVHFNGTSTRFAQIKAGSDRMTFRPVPQPLKMSETLAKETERKFPMRANWADGLSTLTVTTIELPESLETKIPESVSIASDIGTYSLTYTLIDRKLTVERRLMAMPIDIPPSRYKAFAEFCKAVDDAEKRQVVLKMKQK